ncbi:MAG: hypothetical protein LBQ54_16535 [Planctomycetaceae bacterium]|jgi:phosphoribosylanthranilate isomerase|nr:hypothetical protein [Planctomycetaceae bacterium]
MKTLRNFALCLYFTCFLSGSVRCEEESVSAVSSVNSEVSPEVEKILKPIVSLTDENTVLIVHVSVDKIDIAKIRTGTLKVLNLIFGKLKTQPELQKTLEQMQLNPEERLNMVKEQLGMAEMMGQGYLDSLKQCGVTDAYLLVNTKVMQMIPVQIVLTADPQKLEDLENLLSVKGLESVIVQKKGSLLVINQVMQGVDQAAFEEALSRIEPTGTVRGELADALERIKKAPVQAVFAFDKTLEMFLGMAMLAAGPSAQNVDLQTVTDGVESLALGIDPMRYIVGLSAKSSSPDAAKALRTMLVQLHGKALTEQVKTFRELKIPQAAIDRVTEFNKKLQKFYPVVREDKLEWVLVPNHIEEYLDIVLPGLVANFQIYFLSGLAFAEQYNKEQGAVSSPFTAQPLTEQENPVTAPAAAEKDNEEDPFQE